MLTATALTAIIGFAIWLVKRWLLSSDDKKQSQAAQEAKGQQEIRKVIAKEQNEEELNSLLDSKLRNIDRLQNAERNHNNP
jgi:hypothetical protein